jgi:ribonuclease P protein component
MLAKKYRLPVQSVLDQKGVIRRGRYFLVKTFPTALPHSRLGVVVGSSVAAKATARNALRRSLYAAVWPVVSRKEIRDYLVIARRGSYPLGASDAIIKELNSLL